MSARDPLDEMQRGAALWLVGQARLERVVRAACDALVAGHDGVALRMLAGISVHADQADVEIEEAIFAALDEQGRRLPGRGSDAATIAVTVAMAEETLDGGITPRELASWAHAYVTHMGPTVLQDLVEMDDAYDLVGVVETEGDEDLRTLAEARRLVASMRP